MRSSGMLGTGLAHVLAGRGTQVTLCEPGVDLCLELGLRPRWQHVADLRARANVIIFQRRDSDYI